MPSFICKTCGRSFAHKRTLIRHMAGHDEEKNFKCSTCSKSFKQKPNLTRHEKICKGVPFKPQPTGSGVPKKMQSSQHHFHVDTIKTAFNNANITWQIKFPDNDSEDYIRLLNESTMAMYGKLSTYQQSRRALKFNMGVHVIYEQATNADILTDPPVVLQTEQFEVYEDTDLNELLITCSEQLQNRIATYESVGSGWIISSMIALDTTVWQLDPLRASNYHPLPEWVQHTKSVRNVQNKRDNMCFKWSVLAGLYEPTDPDNVCRVSSYTACEGYEDAPDFSMLTYPVSLREIKKFEKVNNISVNVYAIGENEDEEASGKNRYIFSSIRKLS